MSLKRFYRALVHLSRFLFEGFSELTAGRVYVKECINCLKSLYFLKGRYFFPALGVG